MPDPSIDLWDETRAAHRRSAEPLAVRLRPRTLDEIVGQRRILGEGKLLRRMLDADRLTSIILHGPPGTGKTTLAEVIAAHTKAHFERANAAMIGVARIREILDGAARRLEEDGRRTILFLDEIHRFARNQQDVLLNDVERGLVVLIGATTENPYFAVNSALVSRSTVLRLEPLDEEEIAEVLRRAVADPRAFGARRVRLDDDAIAHWARTSDGDARRALTALEVAVLSRVAEETAGGAGAAADAPIHVTLAVAEDSIQRKALVHDPTGDGHYDLASALIKSMRGGDPDAAVHWLARMLEAGEDPRFIARRVAILASEDIGLADPRALEIAAAAWTITERVGMPECQLTLAEAVVYMCVAPKSNACARAIWSAMDEVREGRTIPVPMRIRDQNNRRALERETASGAREGPVERYVSPHDSANAPTDYLGVERTYYEPTESGAEARIAEILRRRRE
ncbi:MAG: replication-associated recombination protein A [Phycisphaerales bacterium]